MGGNFPEEILNEIRNLANIAEVVGEHVALRRAGRNLVGLCPFHADAKPSFSVNEDRQIFHCFGCGTGGNVFTFLMKYHQMTFPEAVRDLARRYHVRLPEPKALPPGEQQLRERLLRANELACGWFRQQLAAPSAKRARDYLAGRGISEETMAAFRIGFAPQSWDGLKKHLAGQGVPLDVAERAGLLARKEGGNSAYDRFRDRIVFPIVDVGGGVVAFGGRVLDDSLPKYLNSPESLVYSKSRLLYGLSLSRNEIRRGRCALVVEGYLDLISLWQAGVRHAVATLGTALTRQHLRLLRAQGQDLKVVVVFDSDAAGQAAAARSLGLFLQEGVQARLLVLPPGEDPDSYVRQAGPQPFLEAGERSVALLDFYIDRVAAAHGSTPEGRLAAARELAPVLGSIGSAVERAYYVKRVSERLQLDEGALAREAAATAAAGQSGGAALEQAAARSDVRPSLEREVVRLTLASPEAARAFGEAKAWEEFSDPRLSRLAQEACGRPEAVVSLIDRLDPELAALAAELSLAAEMDEAAVAQAVADCLGRLKAKRALRDSQALAEEIRVAEKAGDQAKVRTLLARRLALARAPGP